MPTPARIVNIEISTGRESVGVYIARKQSDGDGFRRIGRYRKITRSSFERLKGLISDVKMVSFPDAGWFNKEGIVLSYHFTEKVERKEEA
jgi:hypothetical protein